MATTICVQRSGGQIQPNAGSVDTPINDLRVGDKIKAAILPGPSYKMGVSKKLQIVSRDLVYNSITATVVT